MAIIVRPDAVRWHPLSVEGPSPGNAGDYIGDESKVLRGPQAYIVAINREHVIKPHFHLVDQFQIFFKGEGRIGKHDLAPVTVHYTDAYTSYGPILCGSGGLAYYNFRPRSDIGAHWMPQSTAEKLRQSGRTYTAQCEVGLPPADGSLQTSSVIDPEEDGLLAFVTTVGASETLPVDTAGGSGRYDVVLSGSLEADGVELPTESVVFTYAGDRVPPRRSGAQGVCVLTVQAPRA